MNAKRRWQRHGAGIWTALLILVASGFTAWLPTSAEADNCEKVKSAPVVRRTWLNWGGGKAYVFEGDKYVKYDIKTEKPEYTKPIAGNWGKGFWATAPDSAINFGNGFAYFFKGSEYIKYDINNDRPVTDKPQPIAGNWIGLWSSGIDAAFEWKDGKVIFFKGNEYARFDIKDDKVDPEYPKPIDEKNWPGICMTRVDGAINWDNKRAYFFRGDYYVRYDIEADKAAPDYPRDVNSSSWPDLTTGSAPGVFDASALGLYVTPGGNYWVSVHPSWPKGVYYGDGSTKCVHGGKYIRDGKCLLIGETGNVKFVSGVKYHVDTNAGWPGVYYPKVSGGCPHGGGEPSTTHCKRVAFGPYKAKAPPRNDGLPIWNIHGCEVWDPGPKPKITDTWAKFVPDSVLRMFLIGSRFFEKVSCITGKLATAAADAAKSLVGEVADLASAFNKHGFDGVLTFLKNKGGAIVEKIKAIAKEYEPFKTLGDIVGKLWDLVKEIKEACSDLSKLPMCAVHVVANRIPGKLGEFARFVVGPGSWADKAKKIGNSLVDLFSEWIAAVKSGLQGLATAGLDGIVKTVTDFVEDKVLKPALKWVEDEVLKKVNDAVGPIVSRVLGHAGAIEAQAEKIASMLDETVTGLGANVETAKSKLNEYEEKVDQFVANAGTLVTDFAVDWLAEKANEIILKFVRTNLSSVWNKANTLFSGIRAPVVAAVATVPFAGSLLAPAAGAAIDYGYGDLKSKVEKFIEDTIKDLVGSLKTKAKELIGGKAQTAGEFLKKVWNAIKGPYETIKGKVLPLVEAALGKYKEIAGKVKGIRAGVKNAIAKAQALADSYKAQFEAAKAKLAAANIPVPAAPAQTAPSTPTQSPPPSTTPTSTSPPPPAKAAPQPSAPAKGGASQGGTVSRTKSGRTCQKWSSDTPHEHAFNAIGNHNYCRHTGNKDPRTWCYTTDPKVRWEYCN